MNNIAILVAFVIIGSFVLLQGTSYGQEVLSFTTNNTAKVNGTNISISYGITNGKLVYINPNISSKSLIISIQPTGKGTLNMTLPRSLIDAKQNGQDTHFRILINNHGANYDEIESYSERTLSIPFGMGTDKIQVVGTQLFSQPAAVQSGLLQVIRAPFADVPPTIDGRWTTPSEWVEASSVGLENNGSKMFVLAQHDSKFVYVMADIVTDHTMPSSSKFMRYALLMLFDRGDYHNNSSLGPKEIGVGADYTFVNGSQISSNFGSQIWTYDNQSNAVDITAPADYNSSMGFSSANDPFDSNQDHRIYEFRIPIYLLNASANYGFSLQAHACQSQDLVSQCTTIYQLTWPNGTLMSVPSMHGILQLINGTTGEQSAAVGASNNSQILVDGIIAAGIIVAISVYAMARKKSKKRVQSEA